MLIVLQISRELPLEKEAVDVSVPDSTEALAVGSGPVAHMPSDDPVVLVLYVEDVEDPEPDKVNE